MYRSEGLRLSVELEVPQYLAHINQRLTEEHERIIHYLDNSTKLVKKYIYDYVYKSRTPK